jgi:hypothetical protein
MFPMNVWGGIDVVFHSETNYLQKRDLVKEEEIYTLRA